jgi:hypothetical protein
MSNVPKARDVLHEILADKRVGPRTKRRIHRALALLYREKPDRRAPAKRQVIDKKLRLRVKVLRRTTDMTQHEIANRVGLRSSGRISDIVHGKR